MILLTKRQRDLLVFLMGSNDAVATSMLSQHFSVSKRVVRYDIDVIDSWLKEQGFSLKRNMKKGIIVQVKNKDKKIIQAKISDMNEMVLSKEERRYYILFKLLLINGYITLSELSDELFISKNTVINDLDYVENVLHFHGIEILRKPRYGIKLNGIESKIRKVLFFIGQELMKKEFVENLSLNILFDGVKVEDISNALKYHQNQMDIYYTSETREELLLHILISIKRILLGKVIIDETICHVSEKERMSIKKALASIEKIYEIVFTTSDFNYLSKIFAGAKCIGNSDENREKRSNNFKISTVMDVIIEATNRYLGINIKDDNEFYEGMKTHLELAVFRLENNLQINNPLTEKIKYRYPFIFDISKKISESFESLLGNEIPEDEVSYIAMYIGAAFERSQQKGFLPRVLVVCGSGFATSNMLITRLNIMMPELNIIGPVSPEQIEDMARTNDIDFIISTVNLDTFKYKVVVVNPLLENNDIQKLKELIFKNTNRKYINYMSKHSIEHEINEEKISISNLFSSNRILLKEKCSNWKEAIKKASLPLLDDSSIEPCYVDAMIEVVEKYGPYMVFIPEIAFVHASPKAGVNRDCISMMTLEEQVVFGVGNKDKVSIIIVFGTNKADKHFEVLGKLVNILENKKNIELLKKCSSVEEILKISN